MTRTERILLAVSAPIVTVAMLAVAWITLPGVRECPSFYCGRNFDPGGMNVFGHQWFTPAQTLLTAVAIFLGAWLLAWGLFPSGFRWTSVGFGLLTLACVIAFTLPSYITGPAPSVPCSTPGLGGPVVGRCQAGEPPSNDRAPERGLIVLGGVVCLTYGLRRDRRNANPSRAFASA